MSKELICNIWDVEFGSAAHIRTPNGMHFLLDAGKNSNGFSPANHLKDVYKVNKIDLFVLSHPHEDHLHDIENIKNNFTIQRLWRNKHIPKRLVDFSSSDVLKVWEGIDRTYTKTPDEPLKSGLERKGYTVKEEWLESGKDNLNNYSLVTTYTYNDVMIIFPGDLETEGWEALLKNTEFRADMNAETKILIAPHHGRKSAVRNNDKSPYTDFLEAIRPNLVIISDKHGVSHTEPSLYNSYSTGLNVFSNGNKDKKKVVSTKTNNCITIKVSELDSEPQITLK